MLSLKWNTLFVILYLCTSQIAFAERYKDYRNYKYYDIKGSGDAVENLKSDLPENGDTIIYSQNRQSTQLTLAPELNMIFRAIAAREKLNVTLLYSDISKLIRLEKAPSMRTLKEGISWDAYYDVNDLYKYLTNINNTYPKWTELIVGGESYEGRQILGLRINTPTQDGAEKPVFFIESGIHAREWIAPASTTYFINQLLTSVDPNITRLRDQFDWRIFPTVNPDGYHYSYTFDRMWRKTRSLSSNGCRGADPNRNWDYNWGKQSTSHNPCDYQLYCGSQPFSEIETKTLSSYISGVKNLLVYVGLHSYASILLLPFSDSVKHIENYEDLIEIGNTSLEYGSKVNNVRYDGLGTAAEILYAASGGSMDWVRHALEVPIVYTYELRGSSFHWPPARIPEQGEELTQMLLGLATEAKNLGYY